MDRFLDKCFVAFILCGLPLMFVLEKVGIFPYRNGLFSSTFRKEFERAIYCSATTILVVVIGLLAVVRYWVVVAQ